MNLFENNWYVYFHRKPTDLKLFYIGIGMVKDYQKRYRSSYNRNQHWLNTVTKHGGFNHEKVAENLTLKDACELEEFLIAEYGLESLTNITAGGEGHRSKHTEEVKEKMSKTHLGVPLQKHHADAIRASRKYGKEHWRSKAVIDTLTGEVYGSVKIAAESNNMKHTTLWTILSGKVKNKTNMIYLKTTI